MSTSHGTPVGSPADAIYLGNLITMVDARPRAEALAVKDGRIVAVGSRAEVLARRGAGTRVVELGERTMLPGFLDGHSHFINALQVISQANVYPAPFGPGNSIPGIVGALRELQEREKLPKGALLQAYGYDGDALEEKRELTAADLDAAFPENPVMVGHVSLHGAVLNSLALRTFGITADTPTPPGGVILRKPGSNEPSGLLMETAFLPIFAKLPQPGPEEELERLVEAQRLYAAAGITTAQEGASHEPNIATLERGAEQGKLFLDVVAYPFITDMDKVLAKHPASTFGRYRGHLKLGGIKVTCDGSPQGRTAWFTTPYLTGGPGGEENWRGEPTFPPETIEQMVAKVYGAGLHLLIHCNGDAAIDLFLAAHEKALGAGKTVDRRTTVIHSQFVRRDQLDKYAAYHVVPSFYTEHTYFFGTTHLRNRGKEQTEFLSPLKSALARGLRCANHTDFNVAPIDQLFVLWSAVNRISREGQVIGPDERVTPYQALKGITSDAAWMYGEEATKGTLEVGKLADLVILDRDPLVVPPMEIKDLHVLETFKEGVSIYRRP